MVEFKALHILIPDTMTCHKIVSFIISVVARLLSKDGFATHHIQMDDSCVAELEVDSLHF